MIKRVMYDEQIQYCFFRSVKMLINAIGQYINISQSFFDSIERKLRMHLISFDKYLREREKEKCFHH